MRFYKHIGRQVNQVNLRQANKKIRNPRAYIAYIIIIVAPVKTVFVDFAALLVHNYIVIII